MKIPDKLIFFVLMCLPAAAGTIMSVSGTCVANDGYTQSWSFQIIGDANPSYTCTDPLALNSQGQPMTATFTADASSSINPSPGGQSMVNTEVWERDNQDSLFLGHLWTNLEETVSIQEQETFVTTGGTGQAFLEGQYVLVQDDGLLGPCNTSFGSGTATSGDPVPMTPIPFTFGQPFILSMECTASHPYSIGSINDGRAALIAYLNSVVDANGNAISGVQFTPLATPEPAGPAGVGMVMLMLAGLLRKRAHS
jgi:hypothetical protein